MGCVLGNTADTTCFVGRTIDRPDIDIEYLPPSRLFFNILHPPLNVPALGSWSCSMDYVI